MKDLRAITDRKLLLRLKTAIEALAETPRPDGCRKMAGFDDLWRVRVGDWRIVYRIEEGRAGDRCGDGSGQGRGLS